MQKVIVLCGDGINEWCHITSMMLHTEKEFYDYTAKCVNDTFSAADPKHVNYDSDENHVLAGMQAEWNRLGTHLFPSAVINNITFRGQVNADNIFEAACSAFAELPHGCDQWVNGMGKIEGVIMNQHKRIGVKQSTLLIIVIVLVVVNLIFFYYYRKNMQEEVNKDVKVQVSSAVS